MEKLRPRAAGWANAILWLALMLLYLPFFYLMIGSFLVKHDGQIQGLSLRWYQEVLTDAVIQEAVWRSLLLGFGNGLVSLVIGAMAATALYRTRARYTKWLNALSMISLVMPELVFALSLLSWFFIIKLELSLFTVLLAQVTFSLSFVIFTVGARLASLDTSIEEAAKDLGASDWEIYFKVTLPQLKPALATGFILGFLLSFDDFLITYFMSGVGSDTLPIKLYTSMKMGHSPKLNALSTMMILFSVLAILVIGRLLSWRPLGSESNPRSGSVS